MRIDWVVTITSLVFAGTCAYLLLSMGQELPAFVKATLLSLAVAWAGGGLVALSYALTEPQVVSVKLAHGEKHKRFSRQPNHRLLQVGLVTMAIGIVGLVGAMIMQLAH